MRIIGGKYRGKKIVFSETSSTRPTKDRIRQALFNVLEGGLDVKWAGLRVLDLFAGTGSLGLEAWSRGAETVTFVELNPGALCFLRKNLEALEAAPFCQIAPQPADLYLARHVPHKPFDIVFLDPPYDFKEWEALFKNLLNFPFTNTETLLIIERDSKTPDDFSCLTTLKEKIYGRTRLLFCKKT